MSFQQIRYEVADGVLTITLNRPDRLNAFTPTMQRELIEAFDRSDADDDVRAVIVTGEGRGFCAGADLAGGGSTFDWRERDGGRRGRSARRRRPGRAADLRLAKPVIAAINGPAVGVGITMTLPMDVRIAAAGTKIGFVFARRGIVPEACSSWFLPRLVGISQALEWVETGRVFSSEEALAGGLVRSLHPADEVLAAARALASEIASEDGAGVRGAGAPDDVDDARRRAPDGGAPGRLAGDVRPRPVGRRARGSRVVPREAAGAVQRSRERRAAGAVPGREEPAFR